MLYDLFQWSVIGLLVAGCALYCFFRLAPSALVRRARALLLRAPMPAWLRLRLAVAEAGGCAGGCSACPSAARRQPLDRLGA